MIPTTGLRLVMRQVPVRYYTAGVVATELRQVLQQKWCKVVYNGYGVAHETDVCEWRDVPVAEET